jgi:hypothetical protein
MNKYKNPRYTYLSNLIALSDNQNSINNESKVIENQNANIANIANVINPINSIQRDKTTVSDFIESRLILDPNHMLEIKEIKRAYYAYLYDRKVNHYAELSFQDLIDCEPKLIYKRVNLCKSCKKKHYSGCCDGYSKNNKASPFYMIGVKLRES